MADQFTEVAQKGYFSRLGGSIGGMLIGIVLLPVGIGLLYWNEGRAVDAIRALDRGAKQVVEIAADRLDPTADGKLVHLAGAMSVATPAKDPLFGITGRGLVRLQRTVEMYQWKEDKRTESYESVGGTKTTDTTYTYQQEWSALAINSALFKYPNGHANPAMPVRSETFDSGDVMLGAYRLGASVLDRLKAFGTFAPDPSATLPEGYRREGDSLFHGTGSPASPTVGDVKISFSAVEAQPVSVVAGLSGGTLASFRDTNGFTIALAEPGIASAETIFRAKKQEENNLTWILRGAGFAAMLIGLMLIARPVSMVLAFLPFLEGIAQAGIFLIAVTLALPLALLTIAVAWAAHRPLIGGALIVAAIAIFVLLRRLHRRPAAAAA